MSERVVIVHNHVITRVVLSAGKPNKEKLKLKKEQHKLLQVRKSSCMRYNKRDEPLNFTHRLTIIALLLDCDVNYLFQGKVVRRCLFHLCGKQRRLKILQRALNFLLLQERLF